MLWISPHGLFHTVCSTRTAAPELWAPDSSDARGAADNGDPGPAGAADDRAYATGCGVRSLDSPESVERLPATGQSAVGHAKTDGCRPAFG